MPAPLLPRKAFILAAGFGTRLLPITRAVPKPLLPLGGIPMLDRALNLVRTCGVREVCINLHHGANAIVHHLLQHRPDGLRIQLSFEPEILGTGGALVRAAWFLADGAPFWMLNADVAAMLNPASIRRAFIPGHTIASAWLMSTLGPRTVRAVDHRITHFHDPHPGSPGTYTFCGLHLVDPAVLRYLPAHGPASIIDAYTRAIQDGWTVAAAPVENAFWADIGTPDHYLAAEREFRVRYPSACRPPDPAAARPSARHPIILGPAVPDRAYRGGSFAVPAELVLDEPALALTRPWAAGRPLIACPLPPRGSDRSFTRVYAGTDTAMLIAHTPARAENDAYAGHARFLAALGLPVPRPIAVDARHRLALFEDAGHESLQDAALGWSPARTERFYQTVLQALLVFHEAGYRAARQRHLRLMPAFDDALYRWEHDLFIDRFLREHAGVGGRIISGIRRELRAIATTLTAARPVLVHRDLQSSNILLNHRAWQFIDFQGMRFGPAVYDLASLLQDPYVTIPEAMRKRLLAFYAGQADPASRCEELFPAASVQRLVQALGAYARLSRQPGMGYFAGYISPALDRLAGALVHLRSVPALIDTIARLRA